MSHFGTFDTISIYLDRSTDPEHRESKETVLCPLGGNKWPRRPLGGGGKLQCGGLRPLCEGWLGGSSVEEGVGQPDGLP